MLRSLRQAVRSLLKTPGFTIVAVLTLALGIGASAAVFSVVNAVVLRPLAYPDSGRLVTTRVVLPSFAKMYPTMPVNARFFHEWQACPAFSQLALLDRNSTTLTGSGEPLQLFAASVSANVFPTLQVAPVLGRSFAADEDQPGRPAVAIISHRLWRERFAADPTAIGRSLTLDQRPHTVVGILPPDFRLPIATQFLMGRVGETGEPDVYTPKQFDANELRDILGRFNYEVIGRLAPGATLPDALAQMNVVATRLSQEAKAGVETRGFLAPLQTAVTGPAHRGLFLLLGAIGAVLLIACLNLSVLALARAERRSHDAAVRSALGASRGRLLAYALLESGVIAVVGGALGLLFAHWGLDLLLSLAPADLPRLAEVQIDGRVCAFALVTTIATALLSGLIPAWRTARTAAADVLRSGDNRTATGGRAPRRLRQILTAVEVGVSTVLLATAALLVGSFVRLVHADAGFRAEGVVSTGIAIPRTKYQKNTDRHGYYQRLLAAVGETPGVLSAAVTNALPLQGETWISGIATPGDARPMAERLQTNMRFISADYFQTLGIPLLAGRTFRESDRDRSVALLSAQLAAQLWPGQDPLGRKIVHGQDPETEIIGIVGDVRADADRAPVPIEYQPNWNWPPTRALLVVRLDSPLSAVAPSLRDAIHRVDPDVPVQTFRTMDDLLETSVAQRRFQMRLAAAFALAALVLAALGTYGVVAHSVTQRTRELGIRMAFGADPRSVLRLVIAQSLRPLLFGLAGGLVVALLGGHLLASLLYDTNPRDPLTLALVALTLLVVAFVSCWLPARRATRVDPMTALRTD